MWEVRIYQCGRSYWFIYHKLQAIANDYVRRKQILLVLLRAVTVSMHNFLDTKPVKLCELGIKTLKVKFRNEIAVATRA